ncbi:uncharacterized protein G2W53_040349 [Senna tora]|uniref:Uncharacterized protein n=1 Tax=Senna tora TaxID=362788 RepID=A0A834SF64_9FABA|nr:uncharacterized protein G2W53_040349 [Senna tora]
MDSFDQQESRHEMDSLDLKQLLIKGFADISAKFDDNRAEEDKLINALKGEIESCFSSLNKRIR